MCCIRWMDYCGNLMGEISLSAEPTYTEQEPTCAMHFLHRDANTFSASRGSVSFDGDKMRTVSCTSAQHTMYFMELRGMTKANSQFEWEVYETCRRASKREREQILSGAHGKFVNECCSAFLPSYMYIERCRPMVPSKTLQTKTWSILLTHVICYSYYLRVPLS